MNMNRLEISNFRSFKHEVIELDDITVFVGENNTGKSTIIEAIKLLFSSNSYSNLLSKYDYLLTTKDSKPGDSGDLLIRAEMSERTEDEWPDEIQMTLPEAIDIDENGLRHFYYALKGNYSQAQGVSEHSRQFENSIRGSKGTKANNPSGYNKIRELLPLFHIESIRDFQSEFLQKRGLFKKFLDNDTIEAEKKKELETKLSAINKEIIDVLSNIKLLKENLTKSMEVLSGSGESSVDIEPVPSELDTIIEKAGIVLKNATGIKLPLERQGSGTQSLSVIFLYEAFLTVLLKEEYDEYSSPILLIEEPEAHLHPSAIRIFWRFLEKMPGQKIVTTHSGDIISSVPINKIRRIVGTTGSDRIKRLTDESLSDKEKRFLRNFITYSRGELFFAKIWFLIEGETEQAFFENLLNEDGLLDRKGIRFVEYPHIGVDVITKLANQISMPWFLVSDGDKEGQTYQRKAISALATDLSQDDYIYSFSESTIEVYLMNNGFETFYTSKISPQTSQNITIQPGKAGYYDSVYKAIKNSISKPEVVLEIVESIQSGQSSVPNIISEIKAKLENITV